MKLRISGNSIRLRLLRPDVEALSKGTRLEEKLYLGVGPSSTFSYALECGDTSQTTTVRFADCSITVALNADRVQQWAASNEQVGIYDTLDVGAGKPLDIIVEKDFACLDLSDAENADTFPNPLQGTVC